MDRRGTPDRPVARWARFGGLALLGAVVAAGIAILMIPLAARAFVRGIVLLAAGCVWLATSLSNERGSDGGGRRLVQYLCSWGGTGRR